MLRGCKSGFISVSRRIVHCVPAVSKAWGRPGIPGQVCQGPCLKEQWWSNCGLKEAELGPRSTREGSWPLEGELPAVKKFIPDTGWKHEQRPVCLNHQAGKEGTGGTGGLQLQDCLNVTWALYLVECVGAIEDFGAEEG